MNRYVLAAAALLLFPYHAFAQNAPTYQNSTGQSVEATGTFDMPVAGPKTAIVPVTGLGVVSLVGKDSPSNFYGATITAGAAGGFLVVANLTAAPASGTTLTAAQVLYCLPVLANGIATAGGSGIPDRATVGVVALFSTACGTYTPVATAAVHMRIRAL